MAAIYWKEGRAGLQYAVAFASILFAVTLIVHLPRRRRGNASHPPEVTGA